MNYNTSLNMALRHLNTITRDLAISNERLASGKRINRASDDPAGTIAAARLGSSAAVMDAKIGNANRIGSILDVADAGYASISSALSDIETALIAGSAVGVTASEQAAYQATIDSAIDSIDRTVDSTHYLGQKLLDGSIAYMASGYNTSKIDDVRIASSTGTTQSLAVAVTSDAVGAILTYSDGNLAADVDFTLTGPDGSSDFSFTAGTTAEQIASAINDVTDTTGVSAVYDFVEGITTLSTVDTGSTAAMTVTFTDGTSLSFDEGTASVTGTDAGVTVNGVTATSDGNSYQFSTGSVAGSFTLTQAFIDAGTGGTDTIDVSGDGAGWQLDATADGQINFGQSSLDSTALGSVTYGYLSSLKGGGANSLASGNATTAGYIVDQASAQVNTGRLRAGAISAYTVDATVDFLTTSRDTLLDAQSAITDIDYAQESANNSRLEIMLEVASAVLDSINTNQLNILELLNQS